MNASSSLESSSGNPAPEAGGRDCAGSGVDLPRGGHCIDAGENTYTNDNGAGDLHHLPRRLLPAVAARGGD
jgi:hypothetical protein